MYRLLATDIDDTLLAPDGSLPEANRRALRSLHHTGVAIVFCSGRADVSIRNIASSILALADDQYIVSFNGARVVTADTRRIVTRQYIPPSTVARIAAYARANGLYLQGYVDDIFLVEKETPATKPYAESTKTGYRVVKDLAEAMPEGAPKLLLIDDHDHLAAHRPHLESLDGSAKMMFSKPHYLEIVAAGVNKGSALALLADALEVPVGECIAVGDGANDAEMLRTAGLGLAVANASPEARAAADIVLESRSEAGVMEEIARRFFGT